VRVVCVDFDGVLNSDRYFAAREREGQPVTDWWGEACLDPIAVARLDTIETRIRTGITRPIECLSCQSAPFAYHREP
jgi:hypothetical protein